MSTVHLAKSRTFPVSVQDAYDAVLPAPLTDLFRRRYAVIPPIREVRDQEGTWGREVGQTRTICLADGGSIRETLTVLEPHHRFGYELADISGPMKPLVAGVEGLWQFEPAGTGVRITWSWAVRPASSVANLAVPTFARLWSGFARQGMEEIEKLLLP